MLANSAIFFQHLWVKQQWGCWRYQDVSGHLRLPLSSFGVYLQDRLLLGPYKRSTIVGGCNVGNSSSQTDVNQGRSLLPPVISCFVNTSMWQNRCFQLLTWPSFFQTNFIQPCNQDCLRIRGCWWGGNWKLSSLQCLKGWHLRWSEERHSDDIVRSLLPGAVNGDCCLWRFVKYHKDVEQVNILATYIDNN